MTEHKAEHDTKGQEFAALRAAAEDYKGGRWENLKASSKWGLSQALDWFSPTVILSLLDRIEELRGLLVESRAEADRCTLGASDPHTTELVDRVNAAIGDWRAP